MSNNPDPDVKLLSSAVISLAFEDLRDGDADGIRSAWFFFFRTTSNLEMFVSCMRFDPDWLCEQACRIVEERKASLPKELEEIHEWLTRLEEELVIARGLPSTLDDEGKEIKPSAAVRRKLDSGMRRMRFLYAAKEQLRRCEEACPTTSTAS